MCASTLLPANVWQVSVSWLQGILSSTQRSVTLSEPIWSPCNNLYIMGFIPFDSAFTHQKRPGEADDLVSLSGKDSWVGSRNKGPHATAGGRGTEVGEPAPPIPACPLQEQYRHVSLPPANTEISVNQSYRAELSQSQGKALARIHQLKMSKAFEPDWNLSKNKQTNKNPSPNPCCLFSFFW